MNIKITNMTLKDLNDISDILISDFDEFWNYNILNDELNSMSSHYIVAKLEQEIVGFAGIKVIMDEADIMNIVVKKNFRNNNIGSLLLENLLKLSNELKLNLITLEVNEENSKAIHLYEKFGFKNAGFRKNYYKDKNGIIMTKKLT